MRAEGRRSSPCSNGDVLASKETQGVVLFLQEVSFSLELANSLCGGLKQGHVQYDKPRLMSCRGRHVVVFQGRRCKDVCVFCIASKVEGRKLSPF